VRRTMLIVGFAGILLAAGCARWFPDRTPVMVTPAEVKRYTFDVVASVYPLGLSDRETVTVTCRSQALGLAI